MKVYVITQDVNTPVAVVLDNQGVEAPYSAKEFTVVGAKEQVPAFTAFNEVARLSSAAQKQLGLDGNAMEALKKIADGHAPVTEGTLLYLGVYRSLNGREAPRVRDVYAYNPKGASYLAYEPYVAVRTLQDHLAQKNGKSVPEEISALSPETKNYLTRHGLGPRG
ncbi:MAG: hypothetical protein ACAH83_00310 [Alphaproteobacteria bacterium]